MKHNITVFLYGFSEYNQIKPNPTEELLRRIQKYRFHGAEIIIKILEVSYSKVKNGLYNVFEDETFDIVIGFGACPGCTGFRLEKTAFNRVKSSLQGVDGQRIKNGKIIKGGIDAIDTNLDLGKISNVLLDESVPCYISNMRDLYICNYSYYIVAHYIKNLRKRVKYIFIHIPLTSEYVCREKKKIASLPLSLMIIGAKVVIKEVIKQFKRE